jgi:hypothetical protein
MKEINLEKKGTYEEMVEYIREQFDIQEPTIFKFTKIVETNAKMRRTKEYKNIYKYETEGFIKLNDNNHKENLFKKVVFNNNNYYTSREYFAKMGID